MSGATTDRQQSTADPAPDIQPVLDTLRRAVTADQTRWFDALMSAVRDWPVAEEQTNGRHYQYLIGGEAFDWLLLAERLCVEIDGLIPDDERDALLFHGRLPPEMDEPEFARALGAKQRNHLNFVYGVRVEAALQLAVSEEVYKEQLSRVWTNGHVDHETFQRIYGATREDLLAEFQAIAESTARESPNGTTSHLDAGPNPETLAVSVASIDLSLAALNNFTYWLFKRRLNNADPARVASDTRKGVAMLHAIESRR